MLNDDIKKNQLKKDKKKILESTWLIYKTRELGYKTMITPLKAYKK
jgi:hypothetical protein